MAKKFNYPLVYLFEKFLDRGGERGAILCDGKRVDCISINWECGGIEVHFCDGNQSWDALISDAEKEIAFGEYGVTVCNKYFEVFSRVKTME